VWCLDCWAPTFAGEEADFRGRAEVIAARGECRNFIDRIDILASQLVARWLMFRAAIMRAQHGSSGGFRDVAPTREPRCPFANFARSLRAWCSISALHQRARARNSGSRVLCAVARAQCHAAGNSSDPDLLELMMPILRATSRRIDPSSTSPVVAYGGLADPDVSRDQSMAWAGETRRAARSACSRATISSCGPPIKKGGSTLARDLAQPFQARRMV
jgi:hypothetical protein